MFKSASDLCYSCAGSQELGGYTRMLEGSLNPSPAAGQPQHSDPRGSQWQQLPSASTLAAQTPTAPSEDVMNVGGTETGGMRGQQSKWGFVPGEDDTLELDLKKRGEPTFCLLLTMNSCPDVSLSCENLPRSLL